jgi:ribulose-phosphate 3-epimerase
MKNPSFFFYRNRFLVFYVLIGFVSLCFEWLVIIFLKNYHFPVWAANLIGLGSGLFLAFFLNIRYNFHISPAKRKKALLYFVCISAFSFLVQLYFRNQLLEYGISFQRSRFFISGVLFFFSYLLHRRFSFKDYKKVGVAIYADGVDDVQNIYNKISHVCDFIHIDIVDSTFKPDAINVKAYKAEVVRAFWQKKPIDVHIMSTKPGNWLSELTPYVNTIYVHVNLEEDLALVLKKIKTAGCNPGLVWTVGESFQLIQPYLALVGHVLILAIPKPGFSGQTFQMEALQMIASINGLDNRDEYFLCVDGGVNRSTVVYINADAVVSGSYVLNAPDPVKNIMILQTSAEYERY